MARAWKRIRSTQRLRHGSPARDPTYLQSLPAPLGAIGHSLAPGPIGLMSPAHREAQAACAVCAEPHPATAPREARV